MKISTYSFCMILIILFLCLSWFTGCSGKSVGRQTEKKIRVSKTEDVDKMINNIILINKNSPSSFSTTFTISGSIRNKKFKLIGKANYNKTPRSMDVTLQDYIFKSPITSMFQDGEKIRFFFPAEKKLVEDNYKTINFRNYIDINISFNIIYGVMTGTIPLIENYRVKRGLLSAEGTGSYLILENQRSFETISFNMKVPDKILILNKDTKEKFEIYLKEYIKKDNSYFFNKIRIIAKDADLTMDITCNSVKMNIPVKVKSIKDLKLTKDITIIKI